MENATKALLMAGGILLSILIVTLAASMFGSTNSLTDQYSKSLSQEEITTFNSNFTKYLGKPFTLHVAQTIYNFAKSNNVNVTFSDAGKFNDRIADNTIREEQYDITINGYDSNGYINSITIN